MVIILMNVFYAFLLSTLAGLSTLIGAIPILFHIKDKDKMIVRALAFAAGVMICVSITDLIPEASNLLNTIFTPFPAILFLFIFFVLGVIFSMMIDKFFPSTNNSNVKDKRLYHLGIIAMLAIIMHNLPEGIATFLTTNENQKLGFSLALSIALHNIPEGISIAIPVYYATLSKKKAFFYTFISGISELVGAIIAYLFLAPIINDFIMAIIYSIIAGIMSHIAIYELLKEAKNYKVKLIIPFILGFIVMIMSHLLIA